MASGRKRVLEASGELSSGLSESSPGAHGGLAGVVGCFLKPRAFFHNFHNFHNLHNFMKLWKLWIALSRSQLWVPNEALTQKSKRSDLFISLCFPETFAREIAQPNGQTYRNYWKRVYFHNFHNFINCGNCGNCGKCGNCGNCGINNPQKCLIFPKPWENKTFGVKTVPKSSSQPQRDRKSLFSWFSLPGADLARRNDNALFNY